MPQSSDETKSNMTTEEYDKVEAMLLELLTAAVKAPEEMVESLLDIATVAALMLPADRMERAVDYAAFRAGVRYKNDK